MQTFLRIAAKLFCVYMAVELLASCGSGSKTQPISTQTGSPDFSVSISPSSLTVSPGASSASVAALVTASGNFTGTVALTISDLPAGVTATPSSFNLAPAASQTISLQAGSTAAAGPYTLTFAATSGTLRHTSTLALTIAAATTATVSGIDVTTYHYNNARDGLNSKETALTLANVNASSFGLVGLYPVDGKVDAEPLLVSGITGTDGSTRNVLYAATEHDSVYALDASTGSQLWKTSVLGANETTSDPRNCGQISPEIGITSTPVIDRTRGTHGTIFVVGMSKDSAGKYHQRLHALDLVTGAELGGSPIEVTATYPGAGAGSSDGKSILRPGPVCRARRPPPAQRHYLYCMDQPLRHPALHRLGHRVRRKQPSAIYSAQPDPQRK